MIVIVKDFLDSDSFYWYWFVNIKGIGVLAQKNLLAIYGHPRTLFTCDKADLKEILKEMQLKAFDQSRDISAIVQSYEKLKSAGVRFIHWESEDYPMRLKRLYDAPYGIYLIGRMPDFSKPILSIVGARAATPYGIRITEEYGYACASQGIGIISGLAAGIDAAAHRGALKAGGYTMGILGGGIDTMYPKYNFNLYMEMYERGGVLSEHNLGVPNAAGLFPLRNRLISCLSDGIFVVEARKKSGSLITADQGLEQGKDVFALPGRVTDPLSEGCNNLIKEGAILVSCLDDILEVLKEQSEGDWIKKEAKVNLLPGFDSEGEMIVYQCLDYIEPRSYEALLRMSGLPMESMAHILFSLELKQLIIQPENNIYLKV